MFEVPALGPLLPAAGVPALLPPEARIAIEPATAALLVPLVPSDVEPPLPLAAAPPLPLVAAVVPAASSALGFDELPPQPVTVRSTTAVLAKRLKAARSNGRSRRKRKR
jgi:hypothetical protein